MVQKKKTAVELETYGPKVDALHADAPAGARGDREEAGRRRPSRARRASRARCKTPAGAIVRTVKPGTGPNAAADRSGQVHYTGKLIDGTVFDTSRKPGGQPGRVSAQRRHQVLDRGGGAHEGRRAGGDHLSGGHRLRRGWASATSRRARR